MTAGFEALHGGSIGAKTDDSDAGSCLQSWRCKNRAQFCFSVENLPGFECLLYNIQKGWSRDVRRCQEMMSRDVKRCQEMSGDARRCQEMSRDVKRCQETSGDVKRCQEMSGDVKGCQEVS